jgi:hypothetical protein
MPADWIIDKSHIGKFTLAPQYGDVTLCTVPVRIYDDDGELYLEGRVSARMLDSDESDAFFLLTEAEADLGATRMDYEDPRRGWITL